MLKIYLKFLLHSEDKKKPIEEALEELKKAYETKEINIASVNNMFFTVSLFIIRFKII